MTETQGTSADSLSVRAEQKEPTGWVGWIIFAAVMLFMIGTFQVLAGLVALFDEGYYLVTSNDLVVSVDYTAWGWTHLVIGILCLFAGFGVMVGQMWARVFGIVIAFISAVVNLGFIEAYPVWSTIMIAIDVLIIYALAVHGDEMKALD